MIIELPVLAPAIRALRPANDNEPPAGPPLVRALRRRPGARYATAGNVILPLVFAERMPGWRAHPVARR